jgi:carbamoyl-phosphate synthase large subunit
MATCSRLACRTSRQFLRQQSRVAQRTPVSCRAFTTGSTPLNTRLLQQQANGKSLQKQLRPFSHTALRRSEKTQKAPNAQAYLNSGAISGPRDLVDVQKVLVIGSGGLAIGQAGEFDYSGVYWSSSEPLGPNESKVKNSNIFTFEQVLKL